MSKSYVIRTAAAATTFTLLVATALPSSAVAPVGPERPTGVTRPIRDVERLRKPNSSGTTDPVSLARLAAARKIYVQSDTRFLRSSELAKRLRARPEFGRLGLTIVYLKSDADLIVDVERIFAIYEYSVSDAGSGYAYDDAAIPTLLGSASDKIAKRLLTMLASARQGQYVPYGESAKQRYPHSDVDMPVSLGPGTVRTHEFAVKDEAYFIMIRAEKRLPFGEQACALGMLSGPTERAGCGGPPLLQGTWTVWDEGRLVEQGTIPTAGSAMWTAQHMFKISGSFLGKVGRKYAVEMRFTKDGTPLNACDPHLIVVRVRYH